MALKHLLDPGILKDLKFQSQFEEIDIENVEEPEPNEVDASIKRRFIYDEASE